MVLLDVAIIGGGPAGVAAALSLHGLMPEAKVAIFESSTGERWRPGETLSPGAAEILRSVGCWDAFVQQDFLQSFGTRAAWGSAAAHENEFVFSLHGNGWRLDRARFDGMLRECAREAGVGVYENAGLLESDGDWSLRFRGVECTARFVIDATGRAASFAVQRGVRRIANDRLAGAFVLFDAGEDGDTLIEAQEDGWWYSTTVPGAVAVAAFMSDTDLLRDARMSDAECWAAKLAASTLTRGRLRNARTKSRPAIFAAQSQRLSEVAGPGWVAAGDAAMAFDPLSSQGILKALRSGKLASFVAADYLGKGVVSGERYQKIVIAESEAYEKTKREIYGMERRWAEGVFWKRRR